MEILHGETNRMESCCLPYACVRCRVPLKKNFFFFFFFLAFLLMVTPGFHMIGNTVFPIHGGLKAD